MSLLTEYSEFEPLMRSELMGCSPPVIHHALRRSALQFCEDTEAWQEDSVQDIVVDQRQYDISRADARVVRIMSVRIVNPAVQDVRDPNAGFHVRPAKFSLVFDSGSFLLDFHSPYIPSDEHEDNDLVVTRAFVPHPVADTLPDDFLTHWATAIRVGAMAHLMLQVGKPWSNPELAGLYRVEYNDHVQRARFEKTNERKDVVVKAQGSAFAL